MDYGRYKYEQAKREREARKKQKVVTIKEVKMRPNIEDHDFVVRQRQAESFLRDGDKVKATIMFRGREVVHARAGQGGPRPAAGDREGHLRGRAAAALEGRNMS